jgi:hypothetical protein
VGGGHGLLDRLQAVARAHFTDQDAFFGHGGVCKGSENQKGAMALFSLILVMDDLTFAKKSQVKSHFTDL